MASTSMSHRSMTVSGTKARGGRPSPEPGPGAEESPVKRGKWTFNSADRETLLCGGEVLALTLGVEELADGMEGRVVGVLVRGR